MSIDRPMPERVPVLTEVIELAEVEPAAALAAAADPALPDLSDPPPAPADAPIVASPRPPHAESFASPAGADANGIAEAVMRRVELQLEARLREVLAPALARAADTLIREARDDLAATVRETVAAALERELGTRRDE